jgi:hypothetical protein
MNVKVMHVYVLPINQKYAITIGEGQNHASFFSSIGVFYANPVQYYISTK